MNQAERVIAKFEKGPSWLATELNTKPSTVTTWKKRGKIPRWWHEGILRIAKRQKIALTKEDFAE
jgi:hypothetical protein